MRAFQITFKKAIMGTVLVLTSVICIITLVLFQGVSSSYTQLVVDESSDILALYTDKVENKMSGIEKLSFDILCNADIQRSVADYEGQYGTFHSMYTTVYSWLLNYIFNEPEIVSAHLILNDGTTIAASPRSDQDPPADALAQSWEKAIEAGGAPVWISSAEGGWLASARQINSTSGSYSFKQRGVLVFMVDPAALLEYSPLGNRYESEMFSYLDGQLVPVSESELAGQMGALLESGAQSGKIDVGGSRYIYLMRNSALEGWTFLNILHEASLLSSINATRNLYLFLFFVITFITLLIAGKMAGLINRPVDRLTRSMSRVQQGVFEKLEPEEDGGLRVVELEQLSASYDTMVAEIDHLVNEVLHRQLMISEMRYKMLQQQINPHFLFNTLETIHWKAVSVGDEDTSTMVLALSRLLRSSIKKGDMIPLEEDIAMVEDYIAIQRICFEERLDFGMEPLPDELWGCKIPKMTLQPLVENSIRHNLERYAGVCKIRIGFMVYPQEGRYVIQVRDNGRAASIDRIDRVMEGKEQPTGTGLGLKSINERVAYAFGEGYGLTFQTGDKGFVAEVTLPLGQTEEEKGNVQATDR